MRPRRPDRPKQQLPTEIVDSLLACIGELFYPARSSSPAKRKRWAQDRHWYRQRVITWAARWLDSRAVTLRPDRFKQLLLDKLADIKRHAPEQVINWPRYITKCIQDHFQHNGEAIYNEAKTLTVQIDNALSRLPAAPREPDPIRVLALAHQVNKPKARPKRSAPRQPDLFGS